MESVRDESAWLRVERGCATEEELAAVTVTLVSLAAGRSASRAERAESRMTAPWGRRERARTYRAPRSWR
ncbi:hypothetical protein GCM10022384_64220 [Streptomyces marokkonensis]|uniref:Acyl-CoA carboxylase subunit epsilon n=1 Tax=Streptomyces marokkonensis TaxID=324855 RepID=A0ABP7SCT0_9ACTN